MDSGGEAPEPQPGKGNDRRENAMWNNAEHWDDANDPRGYRKGQGMYQLEKLKEEEKIRDCRTEK